MDILSSYIPPASSSDPHLSTFGSQTYPSVPQGSSSSSNNLLKRRSVGSEQGLNPRTKLALSVDRDVLVTFTNKSSRQLNGSRGVQRSSVHKRTFSPMTPIIASPITTPSTSMTSSKLYFTISREGAREKLTALHSEPSVIEQDYLTKGALAHIPPTEQAVLVADPFPPTPPPKAENGLAGEIEQATYVPPEASLPASLEAHGPSERDNIRKRRTSLPLMKLSKPLPPTPPPLPSKNTSQLAGSSSQDAVPAGKLTKHRAKFSLDSDDGEEIWFDSPEEPEAAVLEDGGRDESRSADEWLKDKSKDNIRRYHVLMELLSTELGYLMDLRELVNGYIRQLPTLSCRPPASSSHFGSSSNLSISPFVRSPTSTSLATPLPLPSRSNSNSQFPNGQPSTQTSNLDAPVPPPKDKNVARYMFSDEQLELVTRNIEEILYFHEQFVGELRVDLSPLGFSMTGDGEVVGKMSAQDAAIDDATNDCLEAAIIAVSRKFTSQAPRFDAYETFCSGHPEAFELVRKTQQEHTSEWDAFESQASNVVADMRKPVSCTQTVEGQASRPSLDQADAEQAEARRKRRHSLSSLDGVMRSTRAPHLRSNTDVPNAAADTPIRSLHSRLLFMDYLIKPVQRICKYPLLIDQLKSRCQPRRDDSSDNDSFAPSPGESSKACNANPDVEAASQAMKDVASQVDEARRRHDISTKSSLIATRIANASTAQSSTSLRNLVGHTLSPVFLSSLGASLLAGSMDVIHHHADKVPGNSGIVKSKYLGTFLYMGGYFIMVKVVKGHIYEPRHWFSLASFELFDVPEQEALLPCSIRLSSGGHHFDMAMACQREKEVWISAFRESLTVRPTWINEPVWSLHTETRSDMLLSPADDNSPSDGIPPLPPLPSIQYLGEGDSSHGYYREGVNQPFSRLPRPDFSARAESGSLSIPPSRRSSTASVKAIFLPISESTILIRRASPNARQAADRGLHDVFSDVCLSARYYANTHEEELFQAPRSGFVRTASGLGMAGMGVAAKNRLTKRESVLVPRRKSGLDAYGPPIEVDNSSSALKRAPTTKSLSNRRHAKKLKIVAVPTNLTADADGELLPDSPPALSQCSSNTASNAGSILGSPVTENMPRPNPLRSKSLVPRPDLLAVNGPDYRPIRSRSMVDNMKGFLQHASESPASSVSGHGSIPPSPVEPVSLAQPKINSGLLKWMTGSLRRRVTSAPGAREDSPAFAKNTFSTSTSSSELSPPSASAVRRSRTTKDRRSNFLSVSESGGLEKFSTPKPAMASEPHIQRMESNSSPVRRQSLFRPSISRRRTSTDDPAPSPRISRNFSILRRLSPLNSTVTTS